MNEVYDKPTPNRTLLSAEVNEIELPRGVTDALEKIDRQDRSASKARAELFKLYGDLFITGKNEKDMWQRRAEAAESKLRELESRPALSGDEDVARELAHKILGAHCVCYAEAWPSDTCFSERNLVTDMISTALAQARLAERKACAKLISNKVVALEMVGTNSLVVALVAELAAQVRAREETDNDRT